MRRLALSLLFAGTLAATDVQVIRTTVGLPWLPYVPGFSGQVQVFVSGTSARRLRITVHTAAGDMSQVCDVWNMAGLQAGAVFPVSDIIGEPEVEEIW